MTVVIDKGTTRPARQEFQVLATTNTGNGGWFDIHGLSSLSLFLTGLEAASTVKVEVANGPNAPTNGAILTSTLAPDANNCAQFAITGAFHWLRVTKTQGTTPTPTVGTLHGVPA